jgi:putative autoinducer-2 (AI-2) aldolase
MDWGLTNRLNRIIKPDTGRTVMLAIDHGYFLGPVTKLEKPGDTVDPLLPHADALMLARGVVRNCIPPETTTPLVLRVSGGRSILAGEDLSDEGLATAVDDAVRLNVAAMALSVFVGSRHERQTILNLSKLVDEGMRVGLPVLGVTAVGKELEKRDARYLSLCCRMCAEFGASFVKTYYCEDFEKVAGSCPVPVVIAGGPQMDTEKEVLEMCREAIDRGAVGVDMGRNIWQNEHPVAMIRAVKGVVHEGMTGADAWDLYQSLSGGA